MGISTGRRPQNTDVQSASKAQSHDKEPLRSQYYQDFHCQLNQVDVHVLAKCACRHLYQRAGEAGLLRNKKKPIYEAVHVRSDGSPYRLRVLPRLAFPVRLQP